MSLLTESVASFALGLSGIFRDMVGSEVAVDLDSSRETKFTPEIRKGVQEAET